MADTDLRKLERDAASGDVEAEDQRRLHGNWAKGRRRSPWFLSESFCVAILVQLPLLTGGCATYLLHGELGPESEWEAVGVKAVSGFRSRPGVFKFSVSYDDGKTRTLTWVVDLCKPRLEGNAAPEGWQVAGGGRGMYRWQDGRHCGTSSFAVPIESSSYRPMRGQRFVALLGEMFSAPRHQIALHIARDGKLQGAIDIGRGSFKTVACWRRILAWGLTPLGVALDVATFPLQAIAFSIAYDGPWP